MFPLATRNWQGNILAIAEQLPGERLEIFVMRYAGWARFLLRPCAIEKMFACYENGKLAVEFPQGIKTDPVRATSGYFPAFKIF